jgi:hypothetical protein
MCINTFVCRAVVAIRDIVDMNRASTRLPQLRPGHRACRGHQPTQPGHCRRVREKSHLVRAWKLTRPAADHRASKRSFRRR